MNDLKAFLDGELDAGAASTMQSRIQSDGSLAATADDFRRLSASFAVLTVGPTVTGRVKVLEAIRKPQRTVFPWKFASAMASLVLLVAVVSTLQRGASDEALGTDVVRAVPQENKGLAAGGAQMPDAESEVSERSRDLASGAQMPAMDEKPYTTNVPAPTPPSSSNADLFERQVVRTGALTIRVPSVEKAEAKVTEYVEGVRGYIEDTSSQNLSGKTPSMTMVVRIPQAKFAEALSTFEKLGVRTAKDTQASDVTQQVVDVDARLKNLRSQEETYRAILRNANKVGEIVDVQERLGGIRGEIESMQAQRNALGKLAALATINLRLHQRPPVEQATGGWVKDTWSSATDGFSSAMRSLSAIGIWILVYTPIWLPIAILSVWGWRRALRA